MNRAILGVDAEGLVRSFMTDVLADAAFRVLDAGSQQARERARDRGRDRGHGGGVRKTLKGNATRYGIRTSAISQRKALRQAVKEKSEK
nr:hypothetical protein [Methylobacterium nodulans]